jgi:NitT/TauT family transport system permease protein
MNLASRLRFTIVAAAVGILEISCRAGWVDHRVVIAPSEMARALVRLLLSGEVNGQIAMTFTIIVGAVLTSVALGFAVGLVVHALPPVRRALDPFFASYYAVPIFIFYPAMIGIFGLTMVPILLIGIATAMVAMIIATLDALDRIPPVLGKIARVHRMGTVASVFRLKLPVAAPHLFTGVKLAVSYGFIAVIASEFILAPAGLGRLISNAYSNFDNQLMYALMLLTVVAATAINMVLHTIDRRWAVRRGIARS